MKLTLTLDLAMFPAYITEPNEVAVVLRETADWIENRGKQLHSEGYDVPTACPRILRNFEGSKAGEVVIR